MNRKLMGNRLASEKSPYLLQHADNPVEWYPWGAEAFERAKSEDKPLFVSIGYATCHWCHVMAHESFEDEKVAALMNRVFINIKLDREERPDIDSSCMRVCQLITGHGGWPLNVVMTPDKEPFFAATYIPKNSRFNRPGLIDLIPMIESAWTQDRSRILRSVETIRNSVANSVELQPGPPPDNRALKAAVDSLAERFDRERGGFGDAPWFPMPVNLSFLLQYGYSYQDERAITMATTVLKQMRSSGIFDQIGYGFHRYATDREWRLPHFEKMLYDQALLMQAYTDGYRAVNDPVFRKTVFEIADYVKKRLTSPEGGFWSAEDADSDGEEGTYYVWSEQELRQVLTKREADLCCMFYGIRADGNFHDEASGRLTGTNILHPIKTIAKCADESGMMIDDLTGILDRIRLKLMNERQKRTPPLLDDKILTDWNGLMISALARAGGLFDHKPFVDLAERAFQFIEHTLVTEDNSLLHRYRDGEAGIAAMADDYTFLIRAAIDLFQATFSPRYLETGLKWNHEFIKRFHDRTEGGFYNSDPAVETILTREKPITDGVTPSANAAAAMNLIRLSRLTGRTELESIADEVFRLFSRSLNNWPQYSLHAMEALIMASGPSAEILICGDSGKRQTKQLVQTVRSACRAPHVLLLKQNTNAENLKRLAPFTTSFPIRQQAEAWVCHHFQCESPVDSQEKLLAILETLHRQPNGAQSQR